jgi:hypothetical protein
MVTVPVCEPCNQEKAKDEPYLRDFLTTDLYGYEHPDAQALFQRKVKRSIQHNSSDFARDARERNFPQPVFTPQGIYLGNVTAVPVEKARIDRVLALMVRGLVYHLQKQRIPQDYVFGVNLIKPEGVVDTIRNFAVLPHEEPFSWGEQVCECVFVQAADNPATMLWLLRFYRGVIFLVDTSPHGMEQPEETPETTSGGATGHEGSGTFYL